jgi:hypothetical protein
MSNRMASILMVVHWRQHLPDQENNPFHMLEKEKGENSFLNSYLCQN